MEQRLSLVTLGVRDLTRARRFYEEGLGWTRNAGVEGEVAFYQLGGAILALWGRENMANDARLDLAAATPGKSFGGLALAYKTRDQAEGGRSEEHTSALTYLIRKSTDRFLL